MTITIQYLHSALVFGCKGTGSFRLNLSKEMSFEVSCKHVHSTTRPTVRWSL